MQKIKKNLYTFMNFNKNFNISKIVYFGAPYDGTACFRPGARFAPQSIRNFSYTLETYSHILKKDLIQDSFIFDAGDLNLLTNNKKKSLQTIYKFVKKIIFFNKKPFMVGGEHLVSLPAIKALHEKYENLFVIHLDAHADLRNKYCGDKLSHATVIRRIHEIIGNNKIYQIGIRSGTKEEFDFAEKHCILKLLNNDIFYNKLIKTIDNSPVYITFDMDIFDPGLVPGVGTPEPGGITFKDIEKILYKLLPLNIVGADVVELSPDYDCNNISTIYACKMIRELILLIS